MEKQTAAMDEIHASTINANCALTTTKHTKTVINHGFYKESNHFVFTLAKASY
ncbi:hypothetical protein [Priestia megaterium]|uniref:hypothetical protein n=1 Tax=Priestia megaterium TaxID=1404 RepID=UPI002EB11C09|nr:hypothetical protein [Priestia megaterium]